MAAAIGNVNVSVNLLLQVDAGEVRTIDVIDVPLPTKLVPDRVSGARLIVKSDDGAVTSSIARALRKAADDFEAAVPLSS